MPLTGTEATLTTALKAEIKTQVEALLGVADDPAQLDKFAEMIAKAVANKIIPHIVTNAAVIVASVSGVTTGPGVSGPGTGTIT